MNTARDLRQMLRQIDHKGYKAYKTLEGSYLSDRYTLYIDHVQGDPFAAPSRVRIRRKNEGIIPPAYFESRARKRAVEDYLLRRIHYYLNRNRGGNRHGSGKSGMITICNVQQEILERTAVQIFDETIEIRLEIGFPAYGRTIAAGELEQILFGTLPELMFRVFSGDAQMKQGLLQTVRLSDNQTFIRKELKKRKLAAFVADGSILPRESGVSQKPMPDAVPFISPDSMAVTMPVPHGEPLRGMGIPEGVTVIVGGGYHGKSTLLKALERGVYDHISGDGREYVITDETAYKLRAEEGRCIHREDISMFIRHLPGGTDTVCFETENASGSTSQAANTIEALASGSRLFLIDEDTSAANFMVRDEKMAALVPDEKEPIRPFIRRVRSLYEDNGISTILVIGSSGAYLSAADRVIQMDCFEAKDVTERAAGLVRNWPETKPEPDEKEESASAENYLRYPVRKQYVEKVRVHGRDTISLDRTELDLRYIEQLTDETQTAALAYILQYILEKTADGRKNGAQIAEEISAELEEKGLSAFVPRNYSAGAAAWVRRQEILAALLRYRKL